MEALIHAIKYFHSRSNIKIGTSSFVSHALEAEKRILLQRGDKTNPIKAENYYSTVVCRILKAFWMSKFKKERYYFRTNSCNAFHWEKQDWYLPAWPLDTHCAVRNLEVYLEMTDLKKDTDSFIFRPIKTDKRKRQSLRPKNKPSQFPILRSETNSKRFWKKPNSTKRNSV